MRNDLTPATAKSVAEAIATVSYYGGGDCWAMGEDLQEIARETLRQAAELAKVDSNLGLEVADRARFVLQVALHLKRVPKVA